MYTLVYNTFIYTFTFMVSKLPKETQSTVKL